MNKIESVLIVRFGRELRHKELEDFRNEIKFQLRRRGSSWDKGKIKFTTKKIL